MTKRLNFRLTETEKLKAVEKLKADPTEFAGIKVTKVIRIDGTKYLLDDGSWVLVRFSGTEPVVRFYAEAKDQVTLDKLCNSAEAFIKS